MKCAVAIDSCNECLVETLASMVPLVRRSDVTVAAYTDLFEVIQMVKDTLPALLVVHTNLVMLGPEDWIATCTSANPNMRYTFLTAWVQEHIDILYKTYEPYRVSMSTLIMPFEREQFVAALEAGFR